MGAVLSQEGDTTTPSLAKFKKPVTHPVAFFSATFTPTERNYNIYERELLAVMKALAHWRCYVPLRIFLFLGLPPLPLTSPLLPHPLAYYPLLTSSYLFISLGQLYLDP